MVYDKHYDLSDDPFFNSWGFVCEERVDQHLELKALNPFSLNTLRVWLGKDPNPRVLGAFLRMSSTDIPVDNTTSGGLFAPVDLLTGNITGPATKAELPVRYIDYHPVTNVQISGRKIPFWKEVIDLAESAAFYYTGLRLIAMDIAISKKGPIAH